MGILTYLLENDLQNLGGFLRSRLVYGRVPIKNNVP